LRRFVQWQYGALLSSCEKILVLGEGAREPLLKLFGLQEERVDVVPFGVDVRFWGHQDSAPGRDFGGQGPYVLSVGSDLARDYETLLKARGDTALKIVTRLPLPAALLGQKIQLSSEHSDEDLRNLYLNSLFVVIPLHDVAQPSGQSATLQAMACGKAVILTRTRGLWEPEVMRHMHNCYLVEPGSVADMARAIVWLKDHPAEAAAIGQRARKTVEEQYTSKHLAAALERHLEAIV
jgi:glycosyltransferase involved in cell wall biosynthesis